MIISWIGLIMSIGGVILGQILEGGHIDSLIQPTAAMIVFGGTLGATMLSSTVGEFSGSLRAIKKIFFTNPHDFEPLIKQLVGLATTARKDGILGLEGSVKNIENVFFATHLRHIIDGYDAGILKEMMEDRISKEEEDKAAIAKVYETAGGFSPTVGIIGAVLGLIHVMSNLSDSSKLGSGIAVAFVATVYGVASANLVFLPMANKLKRISHHEMLEMEIIYNGLVGLQTGLNPRVIEEKLFNLVGSHGAGEGAETKKAA